MHINRASRITSYNLLPKNKTLKGISLNNFGISGNIVYAYNKFFSSAKYFPIAYRLGYTLRVLIFNNKLERDETFRDL